MTDIRTDREAAQKQFFADRDRPTGGGSPSIAELVGAFNSRSGDRPYTITRRCWRGDHINCTGEWTQYPDHSGPCECPDVDCPCRPEAGVA